MSERERSERTALLHRVEREAVKASLALKSGWGNLAQGVGVTQALAFRTWPEAMPASGKDVAVQWVAESVCLRIPG